MSPLVATLLLSLVVVAIATVALWLVSLQLRDASIADPFWGTGFIFVSWTAVMYNGVTNWRAVLLAVLITIWGLRLSLFLLWRSRGHGEDSRYVAMRTHHGQRFWWVSLFTVFLLQGVLLWFVAMPIQVVAAGESGATVGMLDALGVLVWLVGLIFESVGDWQLARFKSDPGNAGKVLDSGLWRYTRHPNYFGDFCVWWGIFLIAASGGYWWTIASPLLMSFLLMKVSGVALLEKTIVNRRPKYEDYIRRTNAFFPGLPKKQSS